VWYQWGPAGIGGHLVDPYLYSALTRLTSVPTALRAQLLERGDLLERLRRGLRGPEVHPRLSKALAKLDWSGCEREDRAAEKTGVTLLSWDHPDYPATLRTMADPPPAVYLRGSLAALKLPCAAVVGSRLCTVYGQNVARMLGEDLAQAGMAVASGLARGIDTAAHEGSLVVHARAIAVLGTGIDVPYPSENAPLMRRIEETGGTVLSELPPGTPPMPRNFPMRNRVIAGVSWAVIVVEATEKSGALHTARFALETGREVFAIPHNLTSRTGVGPNTLIQKGAKLLQQAKDVLEELPEALRCMLQQQERLPGHSLPGGAVLSDAAKACLAALRPDEGRGVDDLCASTGMGAPQILAGLLELQMSRLCVELPGMRYALRRVPEESR